MGIHCCKPGFFLYFSLKWHICQCLKPFCKFAIICKNFVINYCKSGFFFVFIHKITHSATFDANFKFQKNCKKRIYRCEPRFLGFLHELAHLVTFETILLISDNLQKFELQLLQIRIFFLYKIALCDHLFETILQIYKYFQKFWYKLLRTRIFCIFLWIGTFGDVWLLLRTQIFRVLTSPRIDIFGDFWDDFANLQKYAKIWVSIVANPDFIVFIHGLAHLASFQTILQIFKSLQ